MLLALPEMSICRDVCVVVCVTDCLRVFLRDLIVFESDPVSIVLKKVYTKKKTRCPVALRIADEVCVAAGVHVHAPARI